MSPVTTHVLDTARGRPASGVSVVLDVESAGAWTRVGQGTTDADGRIQDLVAPGVLRAASYRITFDTGAYFRALGVEAFYPEASIVFTVRDTSAHYHVPLLLSPFGYSTYRGS
jgi:5-hydroxyisourate hydrolase